MHKKKTSKKAEFSFKDMQETKIAYSKDITTWNAENSFLDAAKVEAALQQCLIENDTAIYGEILESYQRMTELHTTKAGNPR